MKSQAQAQAQAQLFVNYGMEFLMKLQKLKTGLQSNTNPHNGSSFELNMPSAHGYTKTKPPVPVLINRRQPALIFFLFKFCFCFIWLTYQFLFISLPPIHSNQLNSKNNKNTRVFVFIISPVLNLTFTQRLSVSHPSIHPVIIEFYFNPFNVTFHYVFMFQNS